MGETAGVQATTEHMADKDLDVWLANARAYVAGAPRDGTGGRAARVAPRAAIIAAADLPVALSALTGANPGTFYEIRTVAGLVPPSAGAEADRSVGAALEFAVRVHEVPHIIVIAHPDCGLVRCLIDEDAPGTGTVAQGQFLPSWTSIAASALGRALRATVNDEERARTCSQEIVRVSFENLMTYQWILDRVFDGRLALHGWYVDPAQAILARFDPESDSFTDA